MQPLFEHGLTFAGFSTRVLELEGDGPPLVFFHGFSDSADTWRATLAELGRRDRAAVAVDLPGFGAASPLAPGEILPQLERFGRAVVGHYARDGEAVVVGNSLGGCMALRLAEQDDLELAGIVPVAPAGLDMAPWLRIIEAHPLIQGVLRSPVPVPERVLRGAVAAVYKRIVFHRSGSVDRRAIATFTSHFADPRTVARYLSTGRTLIGELRDPFRLERIRCPVLVVWGEQDRMVHAAGARRIAERVRGTRIELLDECGHCPQVECAERFTELLLGFAPLAFAEAA